MCELTFHIHCHPHASPASTSLWTKTCDSSFSLVELKRRRARLWKKTLNCDMWSVFFYSVFPKQSPCSLRLAELRWNGWKTPPLQQCSEWRLFLLTRAWLARSNARPLVIGRECPVDRSEKKKKNSSYKTTPCASPEWGWNNHREDACTQKYIKLWQRLTILELPRYDFTFSTRFYRHNRRRRCPPAMTPHNYTGNFVLTPAVSMDANRSANSLLPQLVWLLLLPTLQSFTGSVHVVDNPESDYDSPHHHFCFVVVFYLKTTQLKLLLLVAWEQQLDTLCSSWPSISNKRNSHSPSLNHAFKWGFPLENIVVTLSDLGFNLYSRLCRCVVT